MAQVIHAKHHLKAVGGEAGLFARNQSSGVIDQEMQRIAFGLKCRRTLAHRCEGSQIERNPLDPGIRLAGQDACNGLLAGRLVADS